MPLRLAKFGVPVQAGDPAHLQPSSALELPPATAKSGRLAETPPLSPSNATPEDAPTPPAETDASGRLGPGGQGIALHALAAWVPIDSGELQHLVDQLTAADWLVDAALTDAQLTRQLTERVLPLPCPLRA
jgi:hypothetical protein